MLAEQAGWPRAHYNAGAETLDGESSWHLAAAKLLGGEPGLTREDVRDLTDQIEVALLAQQRERQAGREASGAAKPDTSTLPPVEDAHDAAHAAPETRQDRIEILLVEILELLNRRV